MNNEIKEILDLLNFTNDNIMWCDEIKLNVKQSHLLLDYITNLQEIEKEHKNCTRKHWQSKCAEHYINEKLLQSRIDKAVDFTNRTIEVIKQQPSGNDEWILGRLNGINYCLNGDD